MPVLAKVDRTDYRVHVEHLHFQYVKYLKKSDTVRALVSDHFGNSEKWSQLELVDYENGLL